jgi:ferredoxin
MGHIAPKDIYRKLGKKIDGLTVRVPWNDTLYEILKELYTPDEAEVLVRMPYGLASFGRIARATKLDETRLRTLLDGLCDKGLVFDVFSGDKHRYMPAPMVVGIFELTMMRTRGELHYAEWARLFHEYLENGGFYAANAAHGERVSVMRVVPHDEFIPDYVEVLDYEKAGAIIEQESKFSIGLCSCRHEKLHTGTKQCKTPLDTCTSFGSGAETLVRRGMAREASKSEMLENLARAKEYKLVLTADNVQRNVGFMCQCCGCCCNLMLGVSRHGYTNTVVTSNYIAHIDQSQCTGCEKCAKKCPAKAIAMVPIPNPPTKKPKEAVVDESACLGCGVCALTCHKDAVRLLPRAQRVLYPEDTFERVILASLEHGTLQNQFFDDPQSMTHEALRAFVGGFLRLPPVKQALMSDQLRSRFLGAIRGAVKQRRAYLTQA